MTTGTKLGLAILVTTSSIGYMAYLGASSDWQYYLTVDECIENAPSLPDRPMRISGRIANNSLAISPDRRRATFRLVGSTRDLQVTYSGQVPDNLKEKRDVVVVGQIGESGILQGEEVLTRCASKYASQSNHSSSSSSGNSSADRRAASRAGSYR